MQLSAGRQARLELASYDAFAARDDPTAARAANERLLELWLRVGAEQAAELGEIPDTLLGCVAVLNVAARILEILGPETIDALLNLDLTPDRALA